MQYLLAAAGALAIAVILWKLLTAERVGVPGDGPKPTRPARPVAPDDDPDFLRKLDEQTRKDEPKKPDEDA